MKIVYRPGITPPALVALLKAYGLVVVPARKRV